MLVAALLGGAYPPEPEWEQSATGPAADNPGHVTRVLDGDTLEIATVCRRYRIRLKGVDAAELRNRDGQRARDWATERLAGERITWQAVGMDRYGRFVGRVHLPDGTFVNAEIIREGYARVNTDFPPENLEQFQRLEQEARDAQRGLWGVPPSAPVAIEWDDNGNGRVSCAEARAHGIAPVRSGDPAYPYMRDADGDGVICE